MKLIFEKLALGSEEGLAFKEIRSRGFSCPWHFHAEYELILTLHCPGYRMVGDNITPLEPGDLVLVGSNLPHLWQPDQRTLARRAPTHILIAQFEENFLGRDRLTGRHDRGARRAAMEGSSGGLLSHCPTA